MDEFNVGGVGGEGQRVEDAEVGELVEGGKLAYWKYNSISNHISKKFD